MSMPVGLQPPTGAGTITKQSFNAYSTHGSIGPVIAVLVVIMVLGIVAVMIGRLCSGKRFMGYGQYDVDAWAERKCSSCIDGRISPPLPRPNVAASSAPGPASMPVHAHQETKQEEQYPRHQPENLDS